MGGVPQETRHFYKQLLRLGTVYCIVQCTVQCPRQCTVQCIVFLSVSKIYRHVWCPCIHLVVTRKPIKTCDNVYLSSAPFYISTNFRQKAKILMSGVE